jgi:hypothetical protein
MANEVPATFITESDEDRNQRLVQTPSSQYVTPWDVMRDASARDTKNQAAKDAADKKRAEDAKKITWGQTIKAATIDSAIGSAYQRVKDASYQTQPIDTTFHAITQAQEDGLGEYTSSFARVANKQEYDLIAKRIRSERENRKTLEAAGAKGMIASGAMGVIDNVAIGLLTGGVGLEVNAARGLAMRGVSILGREALESAIPELLLQGTQETRTTSEGLQNFAMGTVGGVGMRGVGSKFSQLSSSAKKKLVGTAATAAAVGTVANTDARARNADGSVNWSGVGENSVNAGAALLGTALFGAVLGKTGAKAFTAEERKAAEQALFSASNVTPGAEETRLVANKATQFMDAVTPDWLKSDRMTLANSELAHSREFAQKLTAHEFTTEGPKVQNAETLRNMEFGSYQYKVAEAMNTARRVENIVVGPTEEAWARDALQTMGRDVSDLPITPSVVKSYAADMVNHALHTGDVIPFPHLKPVVETIRKITDEKLANMLRSGEVTADDLATVTDSSYFNRIYDRDRVLANPKRFMDTVANGFETVHGLSADEARHMATEVYDKLSGLTFTSVHNVTSLASDKLRGGAVNKARTLDLPYEVIAPFLKHDALENFSVLNRETANSNALHQTFGSANRDVILEQYNDAFRDLNIRNGVAEQLHLTDREAASRMLDEFLGVGQKSSALGAGLRSFTRATSLWGALMSNLPEIQSQVVAHGLRKFISDKGLNTFNAEYRALGKQACAEIGVAVEGAMHTMEHRFSTVARSQFEHEMYDTLSSPTMVRNFADTSAGMASFTHHWSGMNLFEDFQRGSVSRMTLTTWADQFANKEWKELSAIDRDAFHNVSIDEARYNSLKEVVNTSDAVRDVGGNVKIIDIDAIKDVDAQQALKYALHMTQSSQIATLGVGSLPPFMKGEFARFMMQFKSFLFAALGMSYKQLQRPNYRMLEGLVVGTMISHVINETRDYVFTTGEPKDRSVAEQLKNAAKNTSVFAFPVEAFDWMDATARAFNNGRGFGGNIANKYDTGGDHKMGPADALGVVMGPAIGKVSQSVMLANDAYQTTKNSGDEEAWRKLERRAVRLFGGPLSNAYGMRWYDWGDKAVHGELDQTIDMKKMFFLKHMQNMNTSLDEIDEAMENVYPKN